jgi:NAD(P)-dependent dehydrogenase (short-subunit alcohol dehydrogenase family)
METVGRPVALVTGASRGIGAATALALAEHGYDVAITYRNKAARANEIAAEITRHGVRALAVGCDITQPEDVNRLFATIRQWSEHLNLLVLNAAGGLERDLVAADPDYPMRINRDAQLAVLDGALPLMLEGGTVIYVTSHWAHLHGQVNYMPAYAPVASTKHAGEQALRARQPDLAPRGIRLLVVTGDLIEGTIMAKMMERLAPGLSQERRQENQTGQLPSVTEMGEAIANAAMDTTLPGGYTVVVGGALDTFERR